MYISRVIRTLVAIPNLSCGPNTACFRVMDSLTGSEDMDFSYQVQTSTGTVEGRTDSALTHVVNSDTEENINQDYVFQIRAGTK